MCTADSDGDGRTNGEELGDPSCVWSVGQEPSRTVNITHPGEYCIFTVVTYPNNLKERIIKRRHV